MEIQDPEFPTAADAVVEAQEKFTEDMVEIAIQKDTTPLWKLLDAHVSYIMCLDTTTIAPESITGATTGKLHKLIDDSGIYEIPGLGGLLKRVTNWLFAKRATGVLSFILRAVWCAVVVALAAIAWAITKAYTWTRDGIKALMVKQELPVAA